MSLSGAIKSCSMHHRHVKSQYRALLPVDLVSLTGIKTNSKCLLAQKKTFGKVRRAPWSARGRCAMDSCGRHQGHMVHDGGVRRTMALGRGAEGTRTVGCSQSENLRVAGQWSRLWRAGKRAVITAPDCFTDTTRMPCSERVGGAAEAAVSKRVFLGRGNMDPCDRRRAGVLRIAGHIPGEGHGSVATPCRHQADMQRVPLVAPLFPLDLRRCVRILAASAARLLMRGGRTWPGGWGLGQEALCLLRGSRPGRRVLLRHGGEGNEDQREKNENERPHERAPYPDEMMSGFFEYRTKSSFCQ